MGLVARIWALKLGFGPQDWDLGLETGVLASRLGFEGEKEEEENFNHNLLKQGTVTADHLTLLQLLG